MASTDTDTRFILGSAERQESLQSITYSGCTTSGRIPKGGSEMISGRRHMLLLCAGLIACSIRTGCGTGGARPDEVRSSPSDEDSAREGGRRVDHRATTSGTAGTSEASAAAPTSPAVVPPGYVGIWSGPASCKFRVIAV